jgi:hypothetical protein
VNPVVHLRSRAARRTLLLRVEIGAVAFLTAFVGVLYAGGA